MVQVSAHHQVLYELNTWLLRNKSLVSSMKTIGHLCFMLTILTNICPGITRPMTGLISLKENVAVCFA